MCIIKGIISVFSHEMLYKMKCGRTQQKEIARRVHEKAYWAFEMWQVIRTFKKTLFSISIPDYQIAFRIDINRTISLAFILKQ